MNAIDLDWTLEPIILYGWPSCRNCLSWSTDGEIAVAAGDYVHILTPKQASQTDSQPDTGTVGLRQWHSARIRTDKFSQSEWPDQGPGSSNRFSLGEEQSLSTVVGLAWSPPGIGPHRRSVLAVLTSNLVLSLWESNGGIGDWTRVFMVNQSLADYFGPAAEASRDGAGRDIDRERRRVRAFAWGPPYRSLQSEAGQVLASEWGVTHIAVANDDNAIIILKFIRKGHYIESDSKATCHVNLPASPGHSDVPRAFSLFQKAMSRQIPVSNLSWSNVNGDLSETFIIVDQDSRNQSMKVQSSAKLAEQGCHPSLEANIRLSIGACDDREQLSGSPELPKVGVLNNAELEKQIEELRLAFDTQHGLDGNCLVRIWGFDSTESHDVACITLHPTDMVEYTTPSLEKCTLLFAPNASTALHSRSCRKGTIAEKGVQLKATDFILKSPRDLFPTLAIDRRLLRIAAICGLRSDNETLRQGAEMALNNLHGTSGSASELKQINIDTSSPGQPLASSDIETCQICKAAIPFHETSRAVARCETGHPYTRCNLSLLAIQEPGISKYCSRCERQYLKAEAIDTDPVHEPHGPSLTTLLFETFDLCPFCQAKFRG